MPSVMADGTGVRPLDVDGCDPVMMFRVHVVASHPFCSEHLHTILTPLGNIAIAHSLCPSSSFEFLADTLPYE